MRRTFLRSALVRNALAVALVSAAPFAAHAQTSTAPWTKLQFSDVPGSGMTAYNQVCPVGFSARQQGSTGAVWTISLEDARTSYPAVRERGGAGVHVELASNKKSIDSVRLLVHYLEPGARAVPLNGAGRRELTKTFEVNARDGDSLRLGADLLVGAAAGIVRVDLERIAYSDGKVWEPAAPGACTARPSLYVPVVVR